MAVGPTEKSPLPANVVNAFPELEDRRATLITILRKTLHWSKPNLAKRASVSVRTVSAVENKKRVRDTTLDKIVTALNDGIESEGLQLPLPFDRFRLDELCEFEDEHGRALPGPRRPELREAVFRRLVLRQYPHQHKYASSSA